MVQRYYSLHDVLPEYCVSAKQKWNYKTTANAGSCRGSDAPEQTVDSVA